MAFRSVFFALAEVRFSGGMETHANRKIAGKMKFLLPVRLSTRQDSRYYARPFTALNEPDAKTFSMRIRRKQRGI